MATEVIQWCKRCLSNVENDGNMCGIALQCKMLVEIYLSVRFSPSKSSAHDEFMLPEPPQYFSLIDLYSEFVGKTFEIFIDKK